jgi:hypothetical protein
VPEATASRPWTADVQSDALRDLQELEIDHDSWIEMLASVDRFSSTLRIASFGNCSLPDVNSNVLGLPVLMQLSLFRVGITESYLNVLLAGCPLLQSLMLEDSYGCSRVRIVSHTLRSIGVRTSRKGDSMLQQLIIEDAPCLERLLPYENSFGIRITISVISEPKLYVLALLPVHMLTLELGTILFLSYFSLSYS